METLPCGCRIGSVDDTFVLEACDQGMDCPTVRYVMAETKRQGKPYSVLDTD